MRRKGATCNTGELVTAATDSSLADNEWLVISDDYVEQHPPYRHLDNDDAVSGVNNILLAYLLPLGHLTVAVITVYLI